MASLWPLRETPAELRDRYLAEGLWSDATLGAMLDAHLERSAGETVRIWSDARPFQDTLGAVHETARRAAAGLRSRGIGPGDVVAFQLPNWMEAAAVFWGTMFAGATLVPIVHFYGAKEVGYILRRSEVKLLVTADRFGYQDFLGNLDAAGELPDLEHVFVVGDDPGDHESFDALLADEPIGEPAPVSPDDPALVAYTSGTTSDPKGVIHTHRSAVAEVRTLADLRGSGEHPMLVGAPVGHAIGMLSGLLLPLDRGHPVHLIDAWDPATVLAAMAEEGLNGGSGATYFLLSLLDHPDCRPEHRMLMAKVGLGGSPVPAAVADRAEAEGVAIVRSYGSTEHPSVTGSRHADPPGQRKYTDGVPMPGVEIRLVGVEDETRAVRQDEPGHILTRGPELFAGYTDPDLTSVAFTPDGWYRTLDVGVLDERGALTITDRTSDVIIRGGENVSAAEVEGELMRIPGVAEVAVVAAPDERLGEHACAFIRCAPDADLPDLGAVGRHLENVGLARQKWPEEIRGIDEFPRTPSGKIQKFKLRERLRADGG